MPACPYCNHPAALKTGHELYPGRGSLALKKFWRCDPCGAQVGCKEGTDIPLGTLASKALRESRQQVHHMFDPLWRSGLFTRDEAYAALGVMLSLEPRRCHVGLFDLDTCARTITALRALRGRLRRCLAEPLP